MKKILSAVVIGLLMIFSYIAGWHHKARVATATANERRVLYWVDPMHPDYKSDHPGIAPDCGMQLEPVYAEPAASIETEAGPLAAGSVGIDPAKQELFGVHIARVERSSGAGKIRVLGRVVPEDTRIYRITSGSGGFIRDTFDDSVGVLVKKDQKLATSYLGETLAVASGYLAAAAAVSNGANKDGSRTMPFPGAVSKQGFSSLEGYSDRLRNLGLSDKQIKQMAETRQLPVTVDIVSPADGFVLDRNISPGQHFDRSMEFYRIADLTKVWIVADVLGSEASSFRPGTEARVTLTNQQKSLSARVTTILPQIDPNTRTLKLRLEGDNPGYALRPDMFVDVELPVSVPSGLTVPVDALIDSGREQRVFIQRSQGVFEPRQVHVGWRSGDRIEIVDGLKEGDRVVSAGTFLVDSESRLKSPQTLSKQTQPEKIEPPSKPGAEEPGQLGAKSKMPPAA
jgi:Cu(I)/Ag(I) efflux system membrane fusion protein